MVSLLHQLSTTDRAKRNIYRSCAVFSGTIRKNKRVFVCNFPNFYFITGRYFSVFIQSKEIPIRYSDSYVFAKITHSYAPNHSKNRNPREIPCLSFDINIPKCFLSSNSDTGNRTLSAKTMPTAFKSAISNH